MKKVIIALSVFILGFVIFTNCGDDKEEVKITDAQKESAKGVVTKVSSLKGVKANPQDQTVFANLNAVYGDAQQLLAAAQTSGKLTGAMLQTNSNCVTQSGDTITYNCAAGDIGGAYSITGTITITGDSYKIDLTITVDSSGGGYGTKQTMTYKGDLTINDTKIDGTLQYDITFDVSGSGIPGGAAAGTYKLGIKYDNVTLDSAGCPTGGKTKIDYDVNAQGQTQKGSIELEYGPKCGDVKMYK